MTIYASMAVHIWLCMNSWLSTACMAMYACIMIIVTINSKPFV